MKGRFSIAVLLLAALAGCKPDNGYQWNDEWDAPDPAPVVPDPSDEGIVGKPRYVWIDAAANFDDYGNSRENIRKDCERIARTGFTDIIVDVRPTTGDVLFKSSVAPALKRIDRWKGSTYDWAERTADFDYLQAFIEEGHAAGLRVNAAINTLVGGYLCPYGLGSEGMVFSDDSKRDWCTVQNLSSGLTSCMDVSDYGPRFLNPAHPSVQDFVVTLVGELAAYKELDGIVLDRCRYDDSGLQSDFSDDSRHAFEKYAGQRVTSWPSDIFAPGTTTLPSSVSSLQRQWLSFRVKTIHDLVEKASIKAHEVRSELGEPHLQLQAGVSVGICRVSGCRFCGPSGFYLPRRLCRRGQHPRVLGMDDGGLLPVGCQASERCGPLRRGPGCRQRQRFRKRRAVQPDTGYRVHLPRRLGRTVHFRPLPYQDV